MALRQGRCLLSDLRRSRGMTQEQVCIALKKQCGVEISPSYLSRIEKGTAPVNSLQSRALCIVLDCTEEQLYNWIKD